VFLDMSLTCDIDCIGFLITLFELIVGPAYMLYQIFKLIWWEKIFVPISQYPLHLTNITLFGGTLVHYCSLGEANWRLDIISLHKFMMLCKNDYINFHIGKVCQTLELNRKAYNIVNSISNGNCEQTFEIFITNGARNGVWSLSF
jgi:aspartate/methionine/tyrosine aminotransferase